MLKVGTGRKYFSGWAGVSSKLPGMKVNILTYPLEFQDDTRQTGGMVDFFAMLP